MERTLRETLPDGKFPDVDPNVAKRFAAIRARDTIPELRVRKLLHASGYRYRLHAPELPGKPDIVFRPRRKVIFVHGCFWHRHDCPTGERVPTRNQEYWREKFARNKQRDRRVQDKLSELGWHFFVVWGCETKSELDDLVGRLTEFLQ